MASSKLPSAHFINAFSLQTLDEREYKLFVSMEAGVTRKFLQKAMKRIAKRLRVRMKDERGWRDTYNRAMVYNWHLSKDRVNGRYLSDKFDIDLDTLSYYRLTERSEVSLRKILLMEDFLTERMAQVRGRNKNYKQLSSSEKAKIKKASERKMKRREAVRNLRKRLNPKVDTQGISSTQQHEGKKKGENFRIINIGHPKR